ncbi:MAG: hypothetical protein II992_03305 [Lachnospiraceae bacterium]|nr:hypothetical protein [Lachnospiraceae bacterium]
MKKEVFGEIAIFIEMMKRPIDKMERVFFDDEDSSHNGEDSGKMYVIFFNS